MNTLKYTKLFVLLLLLSSCDLLEDRQPQTSITFPGELQTADQVEQTLIGAYNDMQDGDFTGSQTLVFGEIMADNARFTGSFPTYQQISQKSMDPTNGSVDGVWTDGYDALNTINIILASLPNIEEPNFDAARAEGEAKFLRAFAHFELVKYFAESPYVAGTANNQLGVPIKTTPVTGSDQFDEPSRNTVEEVYQAVIADLEDAITLLPPSNPQGPGRANQWVAKAMLARVYMVQSDFTNARALAADVVNNGPFRLNESVLTFFRDELSPESIFEIIHTVTDNPGVNNSLPAFYAEGARDDIQITSDLISASDAIITADQEAALSASGLIAEDTRFTQLLGDNPPNIETNSTKFESAVNTDDNAPILRLAEMMLTLAEAETRLAPDLASVPQSVYDLLNQIRTRAIVVIDAATGVESADESAIEYQASDFANKQELLDAILLERRVELAFEGQRLSDLQRLQQDVTGLPFNDPTIAFPIPQDEIDANANITQNPAYLQ